MQKSDLCGDAWFHAICSGAEHLIEHRQLLNKINVFPVADGDTGNNLSSLMHSVLQYAKPAPDFYQTAQSIAKASLMGARGNSGTIFSQFFYGFISNPPKATLSLEDFCTLAKQAVQSAKQAVDQPINGTILSVMEEWAKSFEHIKHKASTIAELIHDSLSFAQQALKNTTGKLEALRRANVVDAGAQGFVYFLEGIANYLKSPITKKYAVQFSEADLFDEDHAEMSLPTHRYCTEALLVNSELSLDEIKHQMSDLGDSIVIAGNLDACRLHIHTNEPQQVMSRLQAVARIEQQKADDMLRQYQMTQHLTRKIALVTDSSADIPQSFIDQHQIHVIPLQLQIDQSFYLDRLTSNSEHIYDLMKDKDKPHALTTSMPNIGHTERILRQIQTHYDDVLIVTIANKLSGTHKMLQSVAEKLAIKSVTVIDSIRTAGALGLLVMHAAQMINENKSLQEIGEKLESLKWNTNLFVAVDDLQYMLRSGRLSKMKGYFAKALKLKPIISMDPQGNCVVAGKAFGFRMALNKLIQIAQDKQSQLIHYAVLYTDNKGIAEHLAKKLERVIGRPPSYIMSVSAVIGVHAGPGCVAVALMSNSDD